MEEVKVLGSENIFSRATPAPSVAGIYVHGGTNGKEFKRGQFLFRNQFGGDTANNVHREIFIGVCINDVKINPQEVVHIDVYTEAFLLGERVFNLQTPSVQQHLRQFASSNFFSTPFNMQYHGIKLEISF